jgi:flagellar motor switch protein FliM
MTGDTATSGLRRIVRPTVPPEPDSVVAARALRMAMTRAAQNHADLPLSVLGIGEEVGPLDDILKRIGDDLMLVAIGPRGGDAAGFIAIDPQSRAALIESQMLGRVLSVVAEPRPPTNADMAMAEPLVTGFLAELTTVTVGTPLAGWGAGLDVLGRFSAVREAGLRLIDGQYRVVRLTLDLGAGGRQGLFVIVLPLPRAADHPVELASEDAPDWTARLAANVLAAPGEVTAVLHRMTLPLARVAGFAIDDQLVLDGVSVSSVRVEALDGRLIGTARLGQMSGMRAVRIEPPRADHLSEAPLAFAGARANAERGLPYPGELPRAAYPSPPMQAGEYAPPGMTSDDGDDPDPDPAPLIERRGPSRPFTPPPPTGFDLDEDTPRVASDWHGLDGDAAIPDLPEPLPGIPPIMADMPTGLAIADDIVQRGGLDLADEVDLDPGA